ncbi:spermidine synthase [Filimonas zeae]|uniref:Polyamine aminopropyltransferase n=1 Tax=Filimonas zeae TaxID=1737353 RepID=A0A917MQP4_9BACT|nr:polyamine aminopropyltransferase [Filimonas zeae]MDR6337437.1 spermidine synthase [Filimonas zeae]GGH58624.1 polyamine aminopropyltransferase 1 [Filimonas zeae]
MDNTDKEHVEERGNSAEWLLLTAVFIIATCGLIYELVAGTLASYVLGDSVTQFSTIIGVYLFSMGVGSYLSKFFNGHLLRRFIQIELLVGIVGGFSSAVLFITFPLAASFRLILYAIVFVTGVLVGLEIPLLMRLLQDRVAFKELVSRVFAVDYVGALLASLIFPLLLVPYLGLIRTSLFFGMLNILVGWYLLRRFKGEVKRTAAIQLTALLFLLAELAAFIGADAIMKLSEHLQFSDKVVYATSSPYQRIVLTRNHRELRLFLNGNLQFSSADEYRYHEALVHPAMQASPQVKRVLVMGGGDGLAVREILKYPGVEAVTLVDLDAVMTKLFTTQPVLTAINKQSFSDKRVKVFNQDAFVWLRDNRQQFDCIIIDFPDPSNFSIGKLYSTSFYQLVKRSLSPAGYAVIQSTSPFVAPKSFWCINATLQSVGFTTIPYHNYVPSFGEWGYVMITQRPSYQVPDTFAIPARYINKGVMQQMLYFPDDMKTQQPLAVNRLNNQALVEYFEQEWGNYSEQ